MPNLDEELARFQAELASIEAQNEAGKSEEDKGKCLEKVEEKKMEAPTVIAAQPVRYSAPRATSSITDRDQSYAAYAGALSGFPMGTSGEEAATAGLLLPTRSQLVHQPRVDMITGRLLSTEEQDMMNQQQSVYEYNPNRPIRSTSSSSNKTTNVINYRKRNLRMAGGEIWEDTTLADWPENDFRLFIGDLGNEVNDEILCHAFRPYPSFQRARIVRDKYTHKTKGFGFVSFQDPFDCAKALREMNGKYIGNRPVKIQKSTWQERNIDVARKKAKTKKKTHLF